MSLALQQLQHLHKIKFTLEKKICFSKHELGVYNWIQYSKGVLKERALCDDFSTTVVIVHIFLSCN